MARLLAIVALTVWTLTVSPAWAQSPRLRILFGADGAGGNPSNLYILSPTTGAIVSNVGPIGFAVTGLAVHPTTGVLYGPTGNQSPTAPGTLITIDKATGQGTVVGAFGIASQTMADLTFTRDGTLYGWLVPGDDLHTIDVTTGAGHHRRRLGTEQPGRSVACRQCRRHDLLRGPPGSWPAAAYHRPEHRAADHGRARDRGSGPGVAALA